MAELQKQYQEKLNQKEELTRKAEHTELMLDRAAKLVSGKPLVLTFIILYQYLYVEALRDLSNCLLSVLFSGHYLFKFENFDIPLPKV